MAKLDKAGVGRKSTASQDRILRAKYHDYCSARVADVLLRLTADEMYLLAQEVAGEPEGSEVDVPSFAEIVRLATDRLTRDLALPDFPRWVSEYEADPRRFEREMLGLWREDLSTSDRGVD